MPIKILRYAGIGEGISLLLLFFVAMPMKYWMGIPVAVKLAGWAHGFLFVLYVGIVFLSIRTMRWRFIDVMIALGASVVPFGTFLLDRSWMKKEKLIALNQP